MLGLERRLEADTRSLLDSLACRFCRIKELAIAAAIAAQSGPPQAQSPLLSRDPTPPGRGQDLGGRERQGRRGEAVLIFEEAAVLKTRCPQG